MESTMANIELQVDELLSVLDVDIQQLRNNLSLLDKLRSLVLKRDEAGLRSLLDVVRTMPNGEAGNESKRISIRKTLAGMLGWEFEEVTLTRLEEAISGPQRFGIAEKKAEITSLIGSLRTEYSRTALLLSECARFNRLLLNNIMEFGRATALTYKSNGTTEPQSRAAFVNMRF
jgi:hypothetical protein